MDSGAEPAKAFCSSFHELQASQRSALPGPRQAAQKSPVLEHAWEVEKMYSQLNADSSCMPAREDIQPVSYEEAPMKASAKASNC